ncbi:MAG: hypothetical protein ACI9MC_002988 [Kiritimatiellia bacterium]|jgi:hypothetical protein
MQDDTERKAESRRAVRLVALCALVALVLYGLLGLVTTDDAYLVRLGRYKEVEFIAADVRSFDRSAYGDRPIVWILGSSITRDAYDVEQVERRLHAAGSDVAVVKFAYNRGASLFTRALVRQLPVRAGDTVVTSITYDNFRSDWLTNSDFTKYGQTLLNPSELMEQEELAYATRLEWSLAATPPSHFHQNRDELGWGLLKSVSNLTGWKSQKIKKNVKYQPYTRTNGVSRRDAKSGWALPNDQMLLTAGQSNYDALWHLRDDLRAANVPFLVLSIPHNPWYYQDYIDEPTVERFHDHFDASDLDYVRLMPRSRQAFYDYKHPNTKARKALSNELADVLSVRLDLPVPEHTGAKSLAAAHDDVPAVLWRPPGGE